MDIFRTTAQIIKNLQTLLDHLTVLHGERHAAQVVHRHILILLIKLHLAEITLKLAYKGGYFFCVTFLFSLILSLILLSLSVVLICLV